MSRLTLAVAGPAATARQLERFLTSLGPAGIGPGDEVRLALAPPAGATATGAHAGGGQARGTADEDAAAGEQDGADALRDGPRVVAGADVRVDLHPPGTTPMRLWGHAMAGARGAHVAVLDLRDPPVAGWAAAWEERGRGRVACGPVVPGALSGAASWAAYLAEYGQFHPPLGETVEEVPGNDVVLPRALLPDDESLRRDGFWKTFHLDELARRQGALPLVVVPAMAVEQERHHGLGAYLRRRVLHGRCYGGRRMESAGHPPRLLCLGFTPLLPVLRTWRVARRLAGKPLPAGRLAAAALPLVLGELAWSWGEALGYAAGAADACERLW